MADFDGSVFVVSATKKSSGVRRDFRRTDAEARKVAKDWVEYPDVTEVTIHEFILLDLIDNAVDEILNYIPKSSAKFKWTRE